MSSMYTDDDGRKRPLTPAKGSGYQEPQMSVTTKVDPAMYKSHDADNNHIDQYAKEGYHGIRGHLAANHSTNFDKAIDELSDLDEIQLQALHRSLHKGQGIIPALSDKEEFARLQQKLREAPSGEGTEDVRGVEVDVLSPEERELFERVRPRVEAPAQAPQSGRLLNVPDLGPVIGRQYESPSIYESATPPGPFYYQGKKMTRRNIRDILGAQIAAERKIQALMELGMTREQAIDTIAKSPGPAEY